MKHTYLSNFPPTLNDGMHIFVFGSNLAGKHGKGASVTARKHWGAMQGTGHGPTGQAYAIPTKDEKLVTLPLKKISLHVASFVDYANACYGIRIFLVTPIGTGLAGYKHADIAPMFQLAPTNCVFVPEWKEFLES